MISLKTLVQYLVPQHALSRLAGYLGNCKTVWFKNGAITAFMKHFKIDLSDAVLSRKEDFPTFNSFFIRKLKPEARPIVPEPDAIACPVDGFVSQIGAIQKDQLFQAKGYYFSLNTLLGSEKLASEFLDGNFATLYLSPKDYHRVHMPFKGSLRETLFIPGKLFSVNEKTTHEVPNLFARNERLVCIFDTAIGPMAVILVGAMIVGSIHTAWDGTSPASTKPQHKTFSGIASITLEKGEELGYFSMGSTAIVLFSKEKIAWLTSFTENSVTRMGQLLAKTKAP